MATETKALTIVERVEKSPAISQLDESAQSLIELLPDEAAARRFRQVVVQALMKNPDLLDCTPSSVVRSVFEAAAMGLEPTGAYGGAHLVPYNVKVGDRYEKQAQLIPDYRGVIQMVTRPDRNGRPSDVLSIEARVVKEDDEFTYEEGSDAWVKHVPSLAPDRSTKVTTHVYAIARLRASGNPMHDVMDRAAVERIQKRGKERGFSPWSSDWDEMAKKTVIKRLSKVLPVRPEVRSILLREDELAESESAGAGGGTGGAAGGSRTSRLADRLRATDTAGAPGASEASAGDAEEAVVREDTEPAPAVANGLCGAVSPLDGATCGIAADVNHRIHKQIVDGDVAQTWPA